MYLLSYQYLIVVHVKRHTNMAESDPTQNSQQFPMLKKDQ